MPGSRHPHDPGWAVRGSGPRGGRDPDLQPRGSLRHPGDRQSASLNVTVTAPTIAGNLALFPAGSSASTSTINYSAGQTRANNAVIMVGASAGLAVRCNQASGTTHVILDVNGYFQ